LNKSKSLHTRRHRPTSKSRRGKKNDPFSAALAAKDGIGGPPGVQKKISADTLCDSSAEDMTTDVDVLALAAMQEHMARSLWSQKRLHRPSVATIHSILAEVHSVSGADKALSPAAGQAEAIDIMDDAASMLGDTTMSDNGEADRLGHPSKSGGGGGVDDNVITFDHTLGLGHADKDKHEHDCKDFLQEPLDRKQGERDIQLVEKEILRSGKKKRHKCAVFFFFFFF